jgi:hypothetical protein
MEAFEIDTLLEVHLSCAGSLERAMPAVCRFEIVFIDRKELRLLWLFRH